MIGVLLLLAPLLVAAQGPAGAVQLAMAEIANTNENVAHAVLIVQALMLALSMTIALPRIYGATVNGSIKQGWFLQSKVPKRNTSPTTSGPNSGYLQLAYNKFLGIELPLIGLSVGQFSIICLYVVVLVVAALYKNLNTTTTNDDRFGWIAIAQFPAVVALSLKNGPIGLIGVGYDRLNFLHRFAGRAMFAFALTHGALHARDIVAQPLYKTFLAHAINTGAPALAGLGLLFLTSFGLIRNLSYRLFYYSHIVGFVLFIVAGALHQSVNRSYIYVGVALHLFSNLARIVRSRLNRATITALPGGLTKIEVHGLSSGWNSGQHVRIRFLTSNFYLFESHPFTIANVNTPVSGEAASHSGSLVLYTKAVGPFTNALRRRAEAATDALLEKSQTGGSVGISNQITLKAIVDGPYGGTGWKSLRNASAAFLVAGGSGITFVLPILEDILKNNEVANEKRTVQLVWAIRDPEIFTPFDEKFKDFIKLAQERGIHFSLQVYVTSAQPPSSELQAIAGLSVLRGRPSIDKLLNDFVSSAPTTRGVDCAACGPGDLIRQARAAVGSISVQAAKAVGGIGLYSEEFGF